MQVTKEGAVVGSIDRVRLEEMQGDAEGVPEAEQQSEDDDLDALRVQAEHLGIKVDGRWGADRLRQEIADEQEDD